jgi:hypothetical protein
MIKRLILVFMIAILFMACQNPRSRSGQRAKEKNTEWLNAAPVCNNVSEKNFEKVVILDSSTGGKTFYDVFHYHYKVNRFEMGVKAYAYIPNLYEIGDTVIVPKIMFK